LTPALDALASRGLAFANARTVAPLTLPAHVSIMTGVLPPAHAVRVNGVRFAGTPRALAVRLKDAGYQTGAVVGAFVLDRRFGLSEGFDAYDDRIARDPRAVDRLNAERRAGVVVDAATTWLDRVDRARPWMLWVHVYDPHAPYDAPPMDSSSPVGPAASDVERAYDAEVAYVDRELSRLLTAVDRVTASARTAVIVTGDHGESLGEHGEPTHGMLLFEPALRVPMIVTVPGVAARDVREPVSVVDVTPTAMALAGLAVDPSLDGRNLLGTLDADREIYAETEYPAVAGWSPLRTLVQDRWKAVISARTALFDLANDAGELADLSPARTPLAESMRGRMELISAGDSRAVPAAASVPSDAVDRLRALGYVAPAPRSASASSSAIDPSTVIDQWAAFERALDALNANDTARALSQLRSLVAMNADAPVFRSTYARALSSAGRHREALDAYRAVVAAWPADASLYHELAVAARDAGQRDEALRAEQASLTLDAAQPAAQNGLGLLFADAGRHADAARAFDAATKLDPTSASYLANLGNARRAIDDVAGAEVAYRGALERDADLADAANGLGVVLVQQRRASEAIRWLERAATLDPDFVEARLNLGIALQESGDSARAAEQYRAVLAARGPHAKEREAARALLMQVRR
jgi:arylsulfatase A-like enzyme/Flp pilus assembly protein TadD